MSTLPHRHSAFFQGLYLWISYNSQDKQKFLSMIHSMDLQPLYGKGPRPSLWASSRAARGKTAPSNIQLPKLL